MRVAIDSNPATLKVNVYVFDDNDRHVAVLKDGYLDWIQREPGTMPEQPTISVDRRVWEAIMKEAVGAHPLDDTLKDTRMIRDRLLTMVEAEWKSKQLDAR